MQTLVPATSSAQSGARGEADVSQQVQGSLNRLQTFDKSDYRSLQSDPERDREIQRLLPNYQVLGTGSSDRAMKEQALQRLQQQQLTASGRQFSQQVTDKLSLFRHLPEVRFEIEPDTYDYFIGHPDVVVSLWHAMGISAVGLRQVGQYQYRMANPDGTVSELYFIRRSRESSIIYCDGEFKSPLLKNSISAKGVFCLYSKYEQDANGTQFVRHSADVFVSFPNAAVETAAKLISPVSNYVADRNFQEISLFLHTMSLTMARHPGWVQQLIAKMPGLQPGQAEELLQVVKQNYHAAQSRTAARWEQAYE